MRSLTLIGAVAALLVTSAARADDPAEPMVTVTTDAPPSSPPTSPTPVSALPPTAPVRAERRPLSVSYAWQTVAADGVGVSLLLVGVASSSNGAMIVGTGTFLLGTPLVHLAHGNPGRAVGSLALRGALPTLAFAAGYTAFHRSDQGTHELFPSGFGEGVLLGIGGIVACVAIDALLLAEETPAAPARPQAPISRLSVSPQLAYIRGGAVAGVGGAF